MGCAYPPGKVNFPNHHFFFFYIWILHYCLNSKLTNNLLIWICSERKSLRLLQHQVRLASIEQLRESNLEWTRFYNGYFLDYYGMPYIETHISELISFIFDIPNKAAVIPGTGNDLVSFTYTRDVANFVVKALDLPKWEEEMFCYGDKVTLNQFLGLLEEATGKLTGILDAMWYIAFCETLTMKIKN